MRMSATSPGRTVAYSLIEVLVILVLVSLVAAIAAPRFESLVESVSFDRNLRSLSTAVREARLSAYRLRREVRLEEYFEVVEVPGGWTVIFPESVVITARGVCHGGEMVIETSDRSLVWQLAPPRCVVGEDGPT